MQFQVQDSFFEYFFLEIARFEKRIALSEKKATFSKVIGKISKYKSSKDFTFALFEVLHRLFWQTCAESHKNVEGVHKKS